MSGCADVCLSVDDYDQPSFYVEREVCARKPHVCGECRETIPVGATYQRASGKWDGRMDSHITCAVCVDVRKAFACNGWLFGQLWEDIREQLFDVWRHTGPWDCLAKLTTPEAVAYCTAEFADYMKEWDE